MGIWDDIKKGLKGSREYQEAKAKKKAKKTKVKAKKASPKKVSKAKKSAANKSWSKATKSAKASGVKMTDLIKARNAAKKSGDKDAYAKAQNQINKHYGVKKRHKTKSSGVGRLDRDKVAGKVKDTNVTDIVKSKSKPAFDKQKDAYGKGEESKIKKEMGKSYEGGGMVDNMLPKYGHGGKVEGGGMFDFPVANAKDRNK